MSWTGGFLRISATFGRTLNITVSSMIYYVFFYHFIEVAICIQLKCIDDLISLLKQEFSLIVKANKI